ncbi:irregular chiasm C-roughest protein-like [Penaeus japonicus]|uniref:irregular chiasm C-roughest protein-like n=1 Tax=Penaeus japonicus TaxID=27405 RepID=UPI001C71346E|nr:irregular chiasm C-roughest protein-like [Penaeus japonicus]
MKMVKTKQSTSWKIVQFLLISPLLLKSVRGEQSFAAEPQDTTAKHGEAVTLPCKIVDRRGVVQWTKDGFGLGTDLELQGFSRYKMIVNDSEGIYNLYIRPVLVEDDATYQCQVGGADGQRHLKSTSAKLTVHFPPKDADDKVYLDKSSPMYTTAGVPVRITCEAGLSTPAAKIKWLMNGKEDFPRNNINTTNQRQADSILVGVRSHLDLTPERKHHEANFTCQVSHEALEEPITRTLTMMVKYPPTVTIDVDSVKIKEGDDVKFTCTAEGNPSVLRYRWEVEGLGVVGDHTTEYSVQDITRDRNGATVACIVSNSIGTSQDTKKISVEYAPRFKQEPEDVDADEGEQVTLTCNVDGNPPPEIVWLHEAQKKVIKIGAKLELTVKRETVGTYHCRAAVAGFPEESRSMQVFMRGAPKVSPQVEQFGLEGDTVKVECVIKSVPKPSEIVWTRNAHTIDPNMSRFNILQDSIPGGVRNTLIIHDTTAEDFGFYNCTAKNGYGSHMAEIQLKRQQSLPLVTTLVAIIGGILFLVVVIIVIVLFKKKGKGYKDSGMEKHSMRSSDRSSTHDSVLKVETRTATGSDLSPSEDDDYSSHDDWDPETTASNARRHNHFRYSAGEYGEPIFSPKDGPNNNSGGYVQYVDYSRDYNPPPPVSYNRNSVYSSGTPLNNVDPRYSAAYGNPYLRVPANARTAQNVYGSTAGTGTGAPPTVPPPPAPSSGGAPENLYNGNAAVLNNNLNNNNSAIYGQIGRTNLRGSGNMNNQYIMVPQGDMRHGVHGTHI